MSAAANDLDRVCAWCKKDMGKTPSPGTGTTHGICEECLDKMTKEAALPNEMTMTRAERAEAAKAEYGSAKNEAFSFSGEKWKYEDGLLYHFHDDRWIYKSEEPTLEKAKRVAETQSYAFSTR